MIPAERFIEVWQRADTIEDVCRELGMTRKAASERASKLRGKGIGLQYFSVTRITDYVKLAELADRITEERSEEEEVA